MIVTFSSNVLQDFILEYRIDNKLFPYTHYHQFLLSFVDDIAIFNSKSLPHPVETHLICLQAAFYALEKAGFLISLQNITFLDDQFT